MTDDDLAGKMVADHIAAMSKMSNEAAARMAERDRMVMNKMLVFVNHDDEKKREEPDAVHVAPQG
jgi:hypothetical protein